MALIRMLSVLLLSGCATNAGVVVSSDLDVCRDGGAQPKQDIVVCQQWKSRNQD